MRRMAWGRRREDDGGSRSEKTHVLSMTTKRRSPRAKGGAPGGDGGRGAGAGRPRDSENKAQQNREQRARTHKTNEKGRPHRSTGGSRRKGERGSEREEGQNKWKLCVRRASGARKKKKDTHKLQDPPSSKVKEGGRGN